MDRSDPAPPLPDILSACFEHGHDLILVTDRAGHGRWANQAFRHTIGVAEAPVLDVMALAAPGPVGDSVRACLQQALDAGALADTELALQTRPGTSVWVSARVIATPDHLVWLLLDIGEQRALAARARHLGELLEMVQDFGRLGVWERDIATGKGRWDRHVFGFWGLDPSRGTPDFGSAQEGIHPEDRAVVNATFCASLLQPGRYAHRYRVNRPDGGMRWIHSQWQVKNTAHGQPERVLGIMLDDTEVYELARSLGDASAQLKLAVELADIAVWRHDLKSNRMHFNDRAFGVLGLPVRPEGLAIDEVRALIHPDDEAVVIASARHALHSERPVHMQARYRRADGAWRHMLMRRVVQRAADGTPLAFVGVGLDLTEQVEREQENAKLNQRLELAASAAGIGIWTLDIETGQCTWNDQMYALCGRLPGSAVPSRLEWLEAIVHPDDRAAAAAARAPLLADVVDKIEIEYRIVRADGEIRWQAHRARHEQLDHRSTLIGVVIDVTDQRLARQAARDADQRAALAARSAGIGTWEVRFDDGQERWDEQMFLLRGVPPAAHPPTREQRLAMVHPDDRDLSLDSRREDITSNRPARYEFRVILPDGSMRWLASRSIAIDDEHGTAIRRLGVNWDITDAKAAEAARAQIVVAERASQAKSQFLSRMSHELRTPLNAVLGFAQLLQMQADGSGDADQSTKLRHIQSAGRHLLSLIDGVLDLSSMESGELPLQLQPVDLAALVQQALPLVMPQAQQRGVQLRSGFLRGAVQADPTRLLQVLVNLLSNAIKYNRAGGEVLIEADCQPDATLVRVSDSGRGMDREQLAHLFEPFNRLGAERSGIQGTGIGLTIVKALVEGMGGRIEVRSEPDRGTQVVLRLATASGPVPAGRPPNGRDTPSQPSPPPASRRGQLLYIEDNVVNVTLVEELVRTLPGLDICSEPTGAAGVRRARELQPDLVLVDMQLPDFDGFEVLRRLRDRPETANLPCIALSANAMPEDIERALRNGFSEYWTKPIDFTQFLAAIDRRFPPTPPPPPAQPQ